MDKRYQVRIERALQYVEDHLGERIRLRDVALASSFSEFHFHRVFSGVMNETVNDYVARRRLERAINMLAFKTDITITDIAMINGFSSSANFAKAVKAYFGFTPSEIRRPGRTKDSKIGKILSKYGKDFNPRDLYPARATYAVTGKTRLGDTSVNVNVKDFEQRTVCALSSAGGYEDKAIFETWDRMINWANDRGIEAENQVRTAFCYDNPAVTPLDKCRYDASIVIAADIDVSLPFRKTIIPSGKYAVLYYKGNPQESMQAKLGLYTDWFPDSGFEPDAFPMLERYLNDVRKDNYIEMEIYVKLKPL